MPLHKLDMAKLTQLAEDICHLEKAGLALQEAGLNPTFDLTPGQNMRITTAALMPKVAGQGFASAPPVAVLELVEDDLAARISEAMDRHFGDITLVDPTCLHKPRSTEAAPPAVGAEPVDPPSVLGEVAEGGPDSAEPSRSAEAVAETPRAEVKVEAKVESGGGEEVAAPEAPAAPIPGSASAMAATSQAPLWTPEEDAYLIDLVCQYVTVHGLSRNAAMKSAARELVRPEDGVKWRCHNKLKARIAAALTETAMRQAHTEAPAAETSPESEVDGAAADDAHAPASLQTQASPEVLAAAFAKPMVEAPDDLHGMDRELWRHLQSHRPRWPHTAGTDLDLVLGLSRGEKLPMIAADLGIDARDLKERFHTLTRPIQDAKGNVTLDGGPRLIALLRRIVKTRAEAA